MKKIHFPYLAVALAMTFMPIIIIGNQVDADGVRAVPLLSLLVMNEFAFFVTAIGAYIGAEQIRAVGIQPFYSIATGLCVLLTIKFMFLGIELWPL